MLSKKIIRTSDGKGQAAHIARNFISEELKVATYDLRDKTINFYLASLEMGKDGSSVDEKLLEELRRAIDSFDQEYQDFSFIYLNVTQGSKRVGVIIRDYFKSQGENITKSILEQPLSKNVRPFIHNDRGGLIDSINNIHRLAVECRSHGCRDSSFLDLTYKIEYLLTDIGISNIWH